MNYPVGFRLWIVHGRARLIIDNSKFRVIFRFQKIRSVLITVLILVLLIAFTYRREVIVKPVPGKPFWYGYRKILALLAMTVIPIVSVNWLIPDRQLGTAQERLEFGEKENDPLIISHAYRDLCLQYPDSLELQFRYIDILTATHNYYYKDFEFDDHRRKPETVTMMRIYAQAVAKKSPGIDDSLLQLLPENKPYAHYLRAITHGETGSRYVEKELLKELLINPNSKRVRDFLWQYYYLFNKQKLGKIVHDPQFDEVIPPGFRNGWYFRHGEYGHYFLNIVVQRFGNVEWLTLLSAFLVSLVWLIFLRSMDVFNREKWSLIALVFLGGAVFTILCLPIYDFAYYKLDWNPNGEPFNDFLYCVTVIGGSEELVKMLPWVLFALFSKRMREPYDYLLYASVSALGFAFTENLMYLEDAGNIVSRTIMSSVSHMFDASIVAYAFILAKYRYRQRFWKIAMPVFGFAFACLAHGFYDFWLISESVKEYYYITLLFFVASLHVWFFFKNNALNNSGFFSAGTAYDARFQQDLLTFSMLGILMVEFIAVSLRYGADDGNAVIRQKALIVFLFLVYLSVILQRFDLKRGVWNKWRFRLPGFVTTMIGLPYNENGSEGDRNFVGQALRLFAPKTNPYIGDKLPKSGVCVRRITVGGNPNWYVFQLNTPIRYGNYVETHIVLKNKRPDQLLDEPKIEIYFMFIPDIHLLNREEIDVRDLRYAGRAYSMPV